VFELDVTIFMPFPSYRLVLSNDHQDEYYCSFVLFVFLFMWYVLCFKHNFHYICINSMGSWLNQGSHGHGKVIANVKSWKKACQSHRMGKKL